MFDEKYPGGKHPDPFGRRVMPRSDCGAVWLIIKRASCVRVCVCVLRMLRLHLAPTASQSPARRAGPGAVHPAGPDSKHAIPPFDDLRTCSRSRGAVRDHRENR